MIPADAIGATTAEAVHRISIALLVFHDLAQSAAFSDDPRLLDHVRKALDSVAGRVAGAIAFAAECAATVSERTP